ncbi:histone H1B-like [Phymastichus coffea]|uniref:histone H1B-like n=1 Tax=Phymastichus coffea TaxID=108790 RepID=UPI00273AA3D3|nr:histone H1B-like [Phymastichus coffea]
MVATAAAAAASARKAAPRAATASKPRAKLSHPRTAEMVDAAIAALKEKGGSSLQAIKKYISGTYAVDAEKLSPFIKKYLKSGVVANKLVQTKGKGASGSFRLGTGESARVVKKRAVVKRTAAKKTGPAKPKKKASAKKKILKSVAAKPPKPKAVKKPKATGKAKKPIKKASAKK